MAKRKSKRKSRKSSQAEMLKRVDLVLKLILSGITRLRDICQYVEGNEDINWRVSERTLARYILRANDWLREQANIDNNKELGKALAQCDMLYMNALKVQDYKTCLQIIKEKAELLGIKAPVKINVKGEVTIENLIEGMTDEELEKNIQENSDAPGTGKKKIPEKGGG